MRGRVVKVEGCPCGAGSLRGGMPMWGRVVKVEGCPCGAGSLRGGMPMRGRVVKWRDAHVEQGH